MYCLLRSGSSSTWMANASVRSMNYRVDLWYLYTDIDYWSSDTVPSRDQNYLIEFTTSNESKSISDSHDAS